MVKKRPKVVNILIYLVVLIAVILLAYSYFAYKKSLGEGENFVVCDQDNNCIIALHVHSEVEIKVCGEEIKIPLEAGDKTATHTHKERNLLHFEERLRYDNNTKTILEKEPITLKTFFNYPDINIRFNSTCIDGKCNGDVCNNSPGTLKFYVNDIENNKYENYVWKDGDKIKIIFE